MFSLFTALMSEIEPELRAEIRKFWVEEIE